MNNRCLCYLCGLYPNVILNTGQKRYGKIDKSDLGTKNCVSSLVMKHTCFMKHQETLLKIDKA